MVTELCNFTRNYLIVRSNKPTSRHVNYSSERLGEFSPGLLVIRPSCQPRCRHPPSREARVTIPPSPQVLDAGSTQAQGPKGRARQARSRSCSAKTLLAQDSWGQALRDIAYAGGWPLSPAQRSSDQHLAPPHLPLGRQQDGAAARCPQHPEGEGAPGVHLPPLATGPGQRARWPCKHHPAGPMQGQREGAGLLPPVRRERRYIISSSALPDAWKLLDCAFCW